MKKLFKFFASFLMAFCFFLHQAKAQSTDAPCGWTEETKKHEASGNSEHHCFDVEQVLANCTPVYVRINFHFFTDTDCDGTIQISNTNQGSAYKLAEDLLNSANNAMSNNQIQWQSPGATQICNPIRYVLSGVYTHCLSNAVGGYDTDLLHQNWGVNKNTEINVYVANFPGDANGIGLDTYASFDQLERGLFNHELGHTFSLWHSFFEDFCDDTPQVTHSWDKNCDGDTNDSGEQYLQCWGYIEPNKVFGQPGFADGNNNNVHDCSENPPCSDRPCCDWAYIDNNVMSYNAFKSSFTECQLERMLTDLAENKCDYIASVGGCPPPSAFITQTPQAILNTTYCSECIILRASFNDDEYRLQVIEIANGQTAYDSGWKDGPVNNFCFSTGQLGLGNHLKPNTQYKVILTVENYCGDEDSDEYIFTTPSSKCTVDGDPDPNTHLSMRVSPNPATNTINIGFDANLNEKFALLATNVLTGTSSILIQNHYAVDGENTLDVSVSALPSGNYTLTLIGDNHLFQNHLIKF